MNGYDVESYDSDLDAWVIETQRTDRKVAEQDIEILKFLGKRARIVGDES